jgi:hypothetical protein
MRFGVAKRITAMPIASYFAVIAFMIKNNPIAGESS